MSRWRDPSPFAVGAVLVVGIGVLLSVFDLLRKTVFRDASWNYNYLPFQYVYDPPALAALLLLLAAGILLFPRATDLPPERFAVALFGFAVALFTLGLFALPLELVKALDVDKRGLYNASVFLVENGPLEFLQSFHRLPQTVPEHEELYAVESLTASQEDTPANHFAAWFSTLDFVPFNDAVADYVAAYTTQKHGPVSVFLVAPFLFVLGTSTAAALVGNVLLVTLTPVVGYYTFRLYFSDLVSRIAAASIAVGPGLFIWMRHAAPVPYDTFTALLVGLATYLFLRGVRDGERWHYPGAAVVLSLAGLTKLTALVMGLPFLLVLLRAAPDGRTFVRRAVELGGAWLAVPVLFLLAGYNFVAQYLYTVYKLTLHKIQYAGGGGGRPTGNPAAALEDPLVGLVGTLYNLRWLNVALCTLAVVFAGLLLADRRLLARDEHYISLALATAFLPYAVWVIFSAGTISRHTVMLSVPLGFIACSGLSAMLDRSPGVGRSELLRFGQAAIAVGALQFAINV